MQRSLWDTTGNACKTVTCQPGLPLIRGLANSLLAVRKLLFDQSTHRFLKISLTGVGVLAVLSATAQAATLANSYKIETLGLTDADHTRNDGYRESSASILTDSGKVGGRSHLYYGGNNKLGFSTWVFDGNTTRQVGLTDADHTRNDGYRESSLTSFTNSGKFGGWSRQYFGGSNEAGFSAWVFDGNSTWKAGLYDSRHSDHNFISGMNELGQAAGTARYYPMPTGLNPVVSSPPPSQSTWFFNGSTTVQIGLLDADHTDRDGSRFSDIFSINNFGVAGTSSRYTGVTRDPAGEADAYTSAWLFDGITTKNISPAGSTFVRITHFNEAGHVTGTGDGSNVGGNWLYDGVMTKPIGLNGNNNPAVTGDETTHLNNAGQAAGFSFLGNSGLSAWVYNGTDTQEVGLIDAEHTDTQGVRVSYVADLNETGQAVGYSARATKLDGYSIILFDPSTFVFSPDQHFQNLPVNNTSAWLYDGNTTQKIGLTDSSAGNFPVDEVISYDEIVSFNDLGQVIGLSRKYDINVGYDPDNIDAYWLHHNGVSKVVGPTGNPNTAIINGASNVTYTNAGFATSRPGYSDELIGLTNTGLVVGHASRRGSLGNDLGSSAWVYDITLDQLIALELSVAPQGHSMPEGFASSRVSYIGDDGIIIGSYQFYGPNDTTESRLFAFFGSDLGLFDLSNLVNGGLNASGWDSLVSFEMTNDQGQFVGTGILDDGSEMVFLMTPVSAVPVPAAIWLFASGLLGLITTARRR